MRLMTLATALAAVATSTSAGQIVVVSGVSSRPPAPVAPTCVTDRGGNIECLLKLSPPQGAAQPSPGRSILIRTQWAPGPCPSVQAEVVNLPGPRAPVVALPLVDHAASRGCGPL